MSAPTLLEMQTDELMGLTPVVLVSVGDTIATGTGWHTVKTIGHASGRRLHVTCTDGTSWLCPMHASTYLRGAA